MKLFLLPLAMILFAPFAQAEPQVVIAPTMNTLSCPAFLRQIENYKQLPETIAKIEKLLLTVDKKDPN
jgi:hypothetical protein